jgi:Glycosyl transferase family 2
VIYMGSPETDTPRIIGHMVVRNELNRYLIKTLTWLAELVDGQVSVFDDGSTDGTVEAVRRLGVHVSERSPQVRSFSEDERACRAAGWVQMEKTMRPKAGDWVLAVDADEFVVDSESTTARATRYALLQCIAETKACGTSAVNFHVAEVFGFDESGHPFVRVDGYWGAIRATRLAAWFPNGRFEGRRESGGSIPPGWTRNANCVNSPLLLHYGYAREKDRICRYQRYVGHVGHSPSHIASILRQPVLTRWAGTNPPTVST